MEGIAMAKAAGKNRERPASKDPKRVKELRESGMGAAAIAREMNIERASVYRGLASGPFVTQPCDPLLRAIFQMI